MERRSVTEFFLDIVGEEAINFGEASHEGDSFLCFLNAFYKNLLLSFGLGLLVFFIYTGTSGEVGGDSCSFFNCYEFNL